MAEIKPWSIPGYVNVDDDVLTPWSAPAYVTVDADTGTVGPWSNNAMLTIDAPPTMDWRPLAGPVIRLPTASGWRHGRALMPVSWPTMTVTELLAGPTFEIAHRGFGKLRPEMTMTAYLNAARLGARSLEISVVQSSDGVFVCSHDDSTLRVSGTDYYIPTSPWHGVIENLNVRWGETDTPTRTDPVPISRLDEVIEEFGRTHVLWIQPKRDIDAAPLVTLLNESPYIDPEHAIIKLWRGQYPYATYARDNGGWKSWGIWLKANRMAWMEYFDILGQEWDAPQANWDGLLATGKRVVGHVINTVAERDTALLAGATGLMAMRPILDA